MRSSSIAEELVWKTRIVAGDRCSSVPVEMSTGSSVETIVAGDSLARCSSVPVETIVAGDSLGCSSCQCETIVAGRSVAGDECSSM